MLTKTQLNPDEYGCMDCGHRSPCPVKECPRCGSAEMVPTVTCVVPPSMEATTHRLEDENGFCQTYLVDGSTVYRSVSYRGVTYNSSVTMTKEDARSHYKLMLETGYKKT